MSLGGPFQDHGMMEELTRYRITNAPISSTFIVYARTNKEGPPSKGITAFLVERGFKGFEVGEKLDKFGVSVAVGGSDSS